MDFSQYKTYIENNINITLSAINQKLKEYTSPDYFEKYLGNPKIIKYSDLNKYNSIDDILPNIDDYIIILIETEKNSGHWMCILKYKLDNDIFIEYFNSYGIKPNYDFNYIDPYTSRLLGQDIKKIDDLLIECKDRYEIIYNKSRMQELDPNIATCGRHCCYRILCKKFFNYNLYDYLKYINQLKHEMSINEDNIVCILCP